jgi:ATP-dependent Clp protease ATP-binding subunit ClpC
MFERYTDRAKRAVELAQGEAAGLGHDAVGTDHLLLGLIGEGGGVAFQALGALGVTDKAAGEAVWRCHRPGSRPSAGWLPWTARFRKVAELALRESLQLGCNYVATEHLLLALIRDADNSEGAQALADIGMAAEEEFTLDDVRAKVLELLRGHAETETRAPGPLSEHVSVRFPVALAAAAKQVAAAEGMEVSSWIRREVEREIDRRSGRCHACGQAVPEAKAR